MSPLGLSLCGLDDAWADRLRADSDFRAAMGLGPDGEVRLIRGWPTALLERPSQAALPLVSFFVIDRRRTTEDPPHVLIQSDAWDWKDMEHLDDVDEAMLAALSGEDGAMAWWDPVRQLVISSAHLEGNDPPDVLPRRRRIWSVALG